MLSWYEYRAYGVTADILLLAMISRFDIIKRFIFQLEHDRMEI